MKITNRTPWRTDHLREIVRRVADQELEPHERKILHVVFATTVVIPPAWPQFSTDDVRHAAWQAKQRYYIVLELPKKGIRPERLAWRLAWRFLRTQPNWRDRKHWDRYRSYTPYAWAKQYPLIAKPKKSKPKGQDLQRHRYELILAAEKRWTKKLKAAQRRLVTLRKKRRYYERALEVE